MKLPSDFLFSQSNLQDYADCPRRFYLRYVRRLAWPAVEAEPALEHERHLRQGVEFHRLVHQHILGIPSEELSTGITDVDLSRWWQNYLGHGPTGLPQSLHPEAVLSAPASGHRLVAKYDVIAVDAGQRAVILELKTWHRRRRRTWLAERLQTRVYRHLLVRAGSFLNGGERFEPQQVEMTYWFANFPNDPESFPYDTRQYEADEAYLTTLIEEIEGLREGDFPLTSDRKHCRYCRYRSLCGRGDVAGEFLEAGEEWDLDEELEIPIDLEQTAEIEF
jgi:CRISPR/Cas system-associated exonuclease Cas4 (RecB family)